MMYDATLAPQIQRTREQHSAAGLFEELYIFEMANNHQGDLDHGLRIIREMAKIARRHGIRAGVKLQYRDLDTFVHPGFRERTDVKHIPRFMSTRLTPDQFLVLVEAIRSEGLVSVVTPFDQVSVARCLEHGVEILKVASCSATDWPLLETVAGSGRPVIVSTGGLDLYAIDSIVSYFTHKQSRLGLMHCVALYPTPNDSVQMSFLDKLIRRYPYVPVGYSGHEAPDNLDVVKVAVAKGAGMLERHVGVATDAIPLNAYSMDPGQTEAWVQASLDARAICGRDARKQVTQAEVDSLRSLQRGVYARRDLKPGEVLKPEDVFYAMPCQEAQVTSGEFGRYRASYTASREYTVGEGIFEHSVPDEISRIRGIIHDVKGMMYEAQIVLGNDLEIELSHHYGMAEFHHTGAVLITVINRSYCKKLIIVLPGQRHPLHAHRLKEECFQLLWGDLEVTVENEVRRMNPGDVMLVEPGQMHAFRSSGGAIFEEVSTTHRRNDSYYEDEVINAKDPLERKTILREW